MIINTLPYLFFAIEKIKYLPIIPPLNIKAMNCEQAKKILITDYFSSIGMQAQSQKENEFWYKSPFVGEQKTGSLKVSQKLNQWYCHNTGKGGNLLDLVMLLHSCDLKAALQIVGNKEIPKNTFIFQQQNIITSDNKAASDKAKETLILKVSRLENKTLVDYLCRVRKIPYHVAVMYCKEVYHSSQERQNNKLKPFFSVGFQNDLQGYELRNEFCKSSSSPKHFSSIKGKTGTKQGLYIFEGFIDFLSALTYYKVLQPQFDTIVLNSLSFAEKTYDITKQYDTLYLFLDNDTAGITAAENYKKLHPTIKNYSALYAQKSCNDFNEFLQK